VEENVSRAKVCEPKLEDNVKDMDFYKMKINKKGGRLTGRTLGDAAE
jgi:hypothetical protein